MVLYSEVSTHMSITTQGGPEDITSTQTATISTTTSAPRGVKVKVDTFLQLNNVQAASPNFASPVNTKPTHLRWRMHKVLLGFGAFCNIALMFLLALVDNRDYGDGVLRCPPWGPEGSVPFREWTRQLYPWLNLTSGRYTASNQAAAIQRGVTGAAQTLLIRVPPQFIQNGAIINGMQTDPITFLLYLLGNRWENTEDERIITDGNALLDFVVHPHEKFDAIITRWDIARKTAEDVGNGMNNFHMLTWWLFRKLHLKAETVVDILRDLDGKMPRTEEQYEGGLTPPS